MYGRRPDFMLLSKKLAFLSLSTVLCVLSMLLASFIKTTTIFFSLFASVFEMLGVYEHKISGGFSVYFASAILGFFLVPDKTVFLFFASFFGYYPIIKALIERLNKLIIEWIIKILAGSIAFFIMYYFFTELFFTAEIKFPFIALFIVAAVVFVIYDIALSQFLDFYLKRIKPNLNI